MEITRESPLKDLLSIDSIGAFYLSQLTRLYFLVVLARPYCNLVTHAVNVKFFLVYDFLLLEFYLQVVDL